MRDRRKTPDYHGDPHGDSHRGVDGRPFASPAKRAARFPSFTEKDAMFRTFTDGVSEIPVTEGFKV